MHGKPRRDECYLFLTSISCIFVALTMHRILLTGGSGYLGGTFLARWKDSNISAPLHALVRTPQQADAVKQYGAEPILIREFSSEPIKNVVIRHSITIVLHLFNPLDHDTTPAFIEALSKVQDAMGERVHFIFTSGAKLFSEHVGMPTHQPIPDTYPDLYGLQEASLSNAPFEIMRKGVEANKLVIDTAYVRGVRAYIFAPCIVYGQGEGFGNQISIQTVAIVKAAKKLRKVYKTSSSSPSWPVCHVLDNTSLYLQMVRKLVSDEDLGHGRFGYYLASPGSVVWDDIYRAIAQALHKRGLVDDQEVHLANQDDLAKMGEALGCPADFVPVQVGGL